MIARSRPVQLMIVLASALGISSAVSHVTAAAIGLTTPSATYRRIGPVDGPQVFVAGSSVLQFALSWPEISRELGQGIENWGVGGSSPEIWEREQLTAATNLTIIGFSIYDLNEHHLSDARATIVPITQTLNDLYQSRADWTFSRRLIAQYWTAGLRSVFPTAARSDALLVGVRRIARSALGLSTAAEDRAAALVLPTSATLDFGESRERLSDWDRGRVLRRLALLKSEIEGRHAFDGPKRLALERMLLRAAGWGPTVVIVLPVSRDYVREFVSDGVRSEFEALLQSVSMSSPDITLVRLDRYAELSPDSVFSDFVHLNSSGRVLATPIVVEHLRQLRGLRSQQRP